MRSKNAKSAAMIFVMTVLLQGAIPPLEVKADAPEISTWTLLQAASDEFDGNELNTDKWNVGIWYDVTTDLAFQDDNVFVRDGYLVLKAEKETFQGKDYTAGAVESKFEVPGTDSYVEVRAKVLDKNANVLSAIWLQSSPLTKAMNPNPEIDIMETFNYSKMTSTLHVWYQEPSIHLQKGKNSWATGLEDISTDFHTYGLERSNGMLRFYFDGELAWERKSSEKSFVELSRHMVLSLEGHLGKPVDEYLPGEFLIDYVRTYYRSDFAGIPQDGSYRLVNRESGMVLGVPEGIEGDKVQLVQMAPNEGDNTRWSLVKNDDGTYYMQNNATGKYVDLVADQKVTSDGTAVIQYEYHGETNQKWYIVPTDNGYFKIISALSGKALCVKDASAAENAPIIQWTYENPDMNDEWKFE